MTTNGKRRDEGAAFRLRERDNSTRQRVRHCRKEGRQDRGQHRQHLSATRQVSAGPVQQRRRELMVGVSAGLGTRREPPCGRVCRLSPFLGDYARTAEQPSPDPPAQNTEKTENKSPATRSRGLFFLKIAQNLNIIAAPDKGCDAMVCRRWVLDRRKRTHRR